jgi:hypothetical protein
MGDGSQNKKSTVKENQVDAAADHSKHWWRRCLSQLLIVVACLGIFTAWVECWFVPRSLAPMYRDRFPLLADHTRGTDLAVLFELLPPPATDGRIRVVLVGDSSIGGAFPVEDFLASKLQRQLARLMPRRRIEVIDFSIIGLRAQEALIMIAKVLASRPDLVVYAMSPRIAPDDTLWATSVRDLALEWDVVSRIGLRRSLSMLDAESFPRTFVYSFWPPMRLRTALKRAAHEASREIAALPGTVLAQILAPAPPFDQPPDQKGWKSANYMWTKAHYRFDVPTPSTRAIAGIIDVCAHEGHCLVYHIPINPNAVRGFEDGLVDEFAEYVRSRAATASVPFRDFRAFGRHGHFRVNLAGNPDAIHPTAEGQEAFAPVLATAIKQLVLGGGRNRAPATRIPGSR